MWKVDKWMMSVERNVHVTATRNCSLAAGLAVLFASYYVFNLEYNAEAATTLEFIQRYVDVIPESSNLVGLFQ